MMPKSASPTIRSSLCVVALIIGTIGVSTLSPATPSRVYPLLIAITLLSSCYGGQLCGFLSVAFGALSIAYFALPGAGFAVTDPADAAGLVGFIATSIIAVLIISRSSKARLSAMGKLTLETEKSSRQEIAVEELGHRLKNDLAGLAALAQLRAGEASSSEAKNALLSMSDRIMAQGRLYSRLDAIRKTDGLVNLSTFIADVVDDFRRAHLSLRPITIELSLTDHQVNTSKAIVIGLVLNELLTNINKYAFPDSSAGLIRISLQAHSTRVGIYQLTVTDNGVGLIGSSDKKPGLGQRILAAMASQIGGSYRLRRSDHLTIGELQFLG